MSTAIWSAPTRQGDCAAPGPRIPAVERLAQAGDAATAQREHRHVRIIDLEPQGRMRSLSCRDPRIDRTRSLPSATRSTPRFLASAQSTSTNSKPLARRRDVSQSSNVSTQAASNFGASGTTRPSMWTNSRETGATVAAHPCSRTQPATCSEPSRSERSPQYPIRTKPGTRMLKSRPTKWPAVT